MRQSKLFTKTRKEAPADETARNARLLIQAGYIHKEMAGVYQLLPLGFRVVEKIKKIVREEMNGIGGQEMIATSLQKKELWERTHRWDDEVVDIWFKTALKNGDELGLAWSHEEPLTEMMRNHVHSYRDLPVFIYQVQTKLRNELRSKSGMMRGREFVMKDAYSFTATEEQHNEIYEANKQAYARVFERLGIGDETFITYADGGAFTEFSHEFQTVCEAGEDITYINREKGIAINEEVLEKTDLKKLGITRDDLERVKTAEVGNIFNFGRQKATDVGLYFKDQNEQEVAVWMGSYGIGVTRLFGVLVEMFADEKGLVWPVAVAPYLVHLVVLNTDNQELVDWANGIYTSLQNRGVEVLYDDRDARAGEKFADSDLLGMPYRVVVSNKGQEQGQFEVVNRQTGEIELVDETRLLGMFTPDLED